MGKNVAAMGVEMAAMGKVYWPCEKLEPSWRKWSRHGSWGPAMEPVGRGFPDFTVTLVKNEISGTDSAL